MDHVVAVDHMEEVVTDPIPQGHPCQPMVVVVCLCDLVSRVRNPIIDRLPPKCLLKFMHLNLLVVRADLSAKKKRIFLFQRVAAKLIVENLYVVLNVVV